MISPHGLLVIKSRLLVTVEMAYKLVSLGGESVELDAENYQRVAAAMLSAPQDLASLFAELDVLRAMVSSPFVEEAPTQEDEHGCSQNVEGTGEPDSKSGGEEAPADNAEASSPVRSGRADRPAASRSKPRRNSSRRKGGKKKLDEGAKEEPVDSSTEA